MAVDTTDGCLPSKMSPPEDMEVGSEGQESYGPVSQEASSRGASPGYAGDSQSQNQNQPSQEVIILYPVTKVILFHVRISPVRTVGFFTRASRCRI